MAKYLNTSIIQYIAIIGSFIFILFIVELIRKKKLKEEYSFLWLALGFTFLFLSIWRGSLDILAFFLGVAYVPAALFIILFAVLIIILIHFSMVISKMKEYIKVLVQEIGLLKLELDKIKNRHNAA